MEQGSENEKRKMMIACISGSIVRQKEAPLIAILVGLHFHNITCCRIQLQKKKKKSVIMMKKSEEEKEKRGFIHSYIQIEGKLEMEWE